MSKTWRRALLWTAVQLAILSVAVMGVPLWARDPQPREHAAVALLLSGQILASAMLRGWLLASFETYLFATSTATLALLIATIAANRPLTTWLTCDAIALAWLSLLFTSTRSRHRESVWWDVVAIGTALIVVIAIVRASFI